MVQQFLLTLRTRLILLNAAFCRKPQKRLTSLNILQPGSSYLKKHAYLRCEQRLYSSPFFKLLRCVRQGSPLHFVVLPVEILSAPPCSSDVFKGIEVASREIKLFQYADDTTIFCRDKNSLRYSYSFPLHSKSAGVLTSQNLKPCGCQPQDWSKNQCQFSELVFLQLKTLRTRT